MNRLAAILDPADVAVGLVATNRSQLFVQAALILERHSWAGSLAAASEGLLARERLASTGLGHGVAIPHCRIKGLQRPFAAVLRLKEPIDFDSPDGAPVMLLICLFVPERAEQAHLEILAEAAAMLSDRGFRERLREARDARTLYGLISGWVVAHGPCGAA